MKELHLSILEWSRTRFHCFGLELTYLPLHTGCGRNSELIINKNNILLKVNDTNFSTSRFTMVLNFFLHSFTFCVQCLLGGHHPPQCTRVMKVRIRAWSVSSESLAISSRIFSFSACKSVGRVLYTFFPDNPTEKSLELLGPANEEAMVHHRNEKSSAAETNGEAQRC